MLTLFEIIPGAVRRNILTRQETDDRIENVIKETYHNRFMLDNFNFVFPVGIFWNKE
jgi:hypothetical protein